MSGKGGNSNITGDVGTLEYILGVLYGRDDCGELAVRLIHRFGSFSGIFKATREELTAIDGITERAAAFFTYAGTAYVRALERGATDVIDSEYALMLQAVSLFCGDGRKGMVCLHIDDRDRVVFVERVDERNFSACAVGGAARFGAKKIALLRYRNSGEKPMIDGKMLQSVLRVAKALELLGAELVDYIEFRPFKFFSLRRAATGKAHTINVDNADKERYEKIEFARSIAQYLDDRQNKKFPK